MNSHHESADSISQQVVAGTATEVSQGFLSPRQQQPHGKLRYALDSGEFGNISVTTRKAAWIGVNEVDKRGWALQELLLSSRLLIFEKQELVWYCQSKKGTSLFRGSPWSYGRMLADLPMQVFNPGNGSGQCSKVEQAEIWHDIVQEYSTRSFTFSTDKPKAILGITRALGPSFQNDEYLETVGMWRRCLLESLAWYRCVGEPQQPYDIGRARGAPSWSWVWIAARIWFATFNIPLASIIDIDCHASSRGGMSTTRLLLEANVTSLEHCRKITSVYYAENWDSDQEREVVAIENSLCLLLGNRVDGTNPGIIPTYVGLIIVKVDDYTFRRQGMFRHDGEEPWQSSPRRVIQLV